ncbi:hypothetical protein AYI68_g4457, partial [Smittium mucronatum]
MLTERIPHCGISPPEISPDELTG